MAATHSSSSLISNLSSENNRRLFVISLFENVCYRIVVISIQGIPKYFKDRFESIYTRKSVPNSPPDVATYREERMTAWVALVSLRGR